MDIPKIIEEILPKTWFTALSSAIVIAALADTFRTIHQEGLGSVLGTKNIWRLRIFFASMALLMLVQLTIEFTSSKGERSIGAVIWPVVLIVGVYGACELALFIWLRIRKKKTLLPNELLRACADNLRSRQTAQGGFRVKGNPEAPVEIWSSAQVLHAFVVAVDRVEMTGITNRTVAYYREQLGQPGLLWSGGTAALMTPNAWILLSLAAYAKSPHWSNLTPDGKTELRGWIKQGLEIVISLQTPEGGWTPAGSKLPGDIRTLPSVIVMWSLAFVIQSREQEELSETEVARCLTAIDLGWKFLRDSANKSDDEIWWDPNPKREWRQKSLGLTLLTYGVLLAVADAVALVPRNVPNAEALALSLSEWLNAQHDGVMRQIDHCLHRDLEDNEADGPWDHFVSDQTGNAKEVPISYFDWPTSALFALRMSKAAKLYNYADAIREQTLANMLIGAGKSPDLSYSFRLAMTLIAAAVDGPIPM